MSDRRRTQRYVLGTPLAGDAMPMQDVVVEALVGDRVTILAPSAHTVDEELMIHLPTIDGLCSRLARVISSMPVAFGGSLQFRVELRLVDTAEELAC